MEVLRTDLTGKSKSPSGGSYINFLIAVDNLNIWILLRSGSPLPCETEIPSLYHMIHTAPRATSLENHNKKLPL